MESQYFRLYNQTDKPLTVMNKGKRVVFEGFSEQLFSADISNALLQKYPHQVVLANDAGMLPQEEKFVKPETLWVANVTGDPRYPKKLSDRKFVNKQWQEYEVDNPAAKPRPLIEEALGEWFEYTSESGLLSGRKPNTIYKIMPYRRVELPAAVARWFVGRCHPVKSAGSTALYRKAIISRKADFEPDGSFSLDELIAYLRYIDPLTELPKSEQAIKAMGKKAKWSEQDLELKLDEAKRDIRKLLYFYVADPKVVLPTRAEFMEFLYGATPAAPGEVEQLADELMAEAS